MRVALLFIDGVGVGPRNEEHNPLCDGDWLLSQFDDAPGTPMPAGVHCSVVDTTFGVRGRPQSASNQTAIYTGLPAPSLLGKHVLGYPTAQLRELLAQHSIVRKVVEAKRTATFVNVFPLVFLQTLELPARADAEDDGIRIDEKRLRKLRPSASKLAMLAGSVLFRAVSHAVRGSGLTADIDARQAARFGFRVPTRSAHEAASIFWREAADFTLFEHSSADDAGHAQNRRAAVDALSTFDAFAREVIAQCPPDAMVIVCSDHGNVEDLSIRNHTRNAVAVLTTQPPVVPLRNLADVGTLILRTMQVPGAV